MNDASKGAASYNFTIDYGLPERGARVARPCRGERGTGRKPRRGKEKVERFCCDQYTKAE